MNQPFYIWSAPEWWLCCPGDHRPGTWCSTRMLTSTSNQGNPATRHFVQFWLIEDMRTWNRGAERQSSQLREMLKLEFNNFAMSASEQFIFNSIQTVVTQKKSNFSFQIEIPVISQTEPASIKFSVENSPFSVMSFLWVLESLFKQFPALLHYKNSSSITK